MRVWPVVYVVSDDQRDETDASVPLHALFIAKTVAAAPILVLGLSAPRSTPGIVHRYRPS